MLFINYIASIICPLYNFNNPKLDIVIIILAYEITLIVLRITSNYFILS